MHLIIDTVTCPENTLKIGQIIMEKDEQMLRAIFGDTFTVKKEIPLDFITDISGNVMLEDPTCCYTCLQQVGNYLLIYIEGLFLGTATQLLRKHGLFYFFKGVNALRIEEDLTLSI